METAATVAGANNAAAQGGISGQQLPLTFVGAGDVVKVIKVRGKDEFQHHLQNLGFVEGAEIKVVAGVQGDLVVEVKGAQVAISRQAAGHIITTAAK